MKIYKNINKLYTFSGFAKKEGVKPTDKDYGPIKKAALVVDKNRILWVGKESKLPKEYLKIKAIDLKNKNVFPSFTESHTHLVFGGDRKQEFELKMRGASYQEIQKQGGGISKTVKDTKKISKKELLEISQKRANTFTQQGVSLLEIKSGYGQDFTAEKKQIEVAFEIKGIKVIPTYLALHSFKGNKEEYVNKVLEKDFPKILKTFSKLKRVDLFIEDGFFTNTDLARVFEKIKKYNLSFCAHVDQLSSQGGALASAKYGALSVEHAVFLDTKEIKELAKYKTVANLLPAADFYLKTPYPKARDLIEAGVRVSLATDYNPGSSPTQNLSFVGVLARREMKMTLPEVWCAYTLNASRALGVYDKGALIKNFAFDFFTTDADVHDFFYEVGTHPVDKLYTHPRK